MGVAIEGKGRLSSWLTDLRVSVLQAQLNAVSAEAERHIGVSRGFEWRLEGTKLPRVKQDNEYRRGLREGWMRADALLKDRGN